MAPILNHHFRDFADKHVVFDDQDHGHEKSFGRDNLHFGSRNSPRRTHGIRSPFERYQGKGISPPGVESSVRNAVYFVTAVGTDTKAGDGRGAPDIYLILLYFSNNIFPARNFTLNARPTLGEQSRIW
jgi:hypothetical protein